MSDDINEMMEEAGIENMGTYVGEWDSKEEQHGAGEAIFPNKDVCEGDCQSGNRDGYGTYIFKSGARYVGEHQDNVRHGKGTFYYPDGSEYEGDWVDNKRNGHGTYRYINGDFYDGEWLDNQRHGKGVYYFTEHDMRYEGVWEKGVMNGYGELLHENNTFIGYWKDSKMVGPGKYVFKTVKTEQEGTCQTEDGKDGEVKKPVLRWVPQKLEEMEEIAPVERKESDLI